MKGGVEKAGADSKLAAGGKPHPHRSEGRAGIDMKSEGGGGVEL